MVWSIQQQVKEFRPHGSIVHPEKKEPWSINSNDHQKVHIKTHPIYLCTHFVLNTYKCWSSWHAHKNRHKWEVFEAKVACQPTVTYNGHLTRTYCTHRAGLCAHKHNSPWYTLVWFVETTGWVFNHFHVLSMHEYKACSCNTKIIHLQKGGEA